MKDSVAFDAFPSRNVFTQDGLGALTPRRQHVVRQVVVKTPSHVSAQILHAVDDAHLATKGVTHHCPHNGPNVAKPRWGVVNEKQLHLGGHPTALQCHEESVAIGHREIGHFPARHVGNDANAIPCVVLFFQHAIHYVHKIVNHHINGLFAR